MLELDGPDGVKGGCFENLYLVSNAIWKVKAFFRAIGFDSPDEKPFRPEWNRVIGSEGRAKIKQRTYEDKTFNEVDKFIDKPVSASDIPEDDEVF